MSTGSPPRGPPVLASLLLRLTLPKGILRESVLGDLSQEFRVRARSGDAEDAARWYVREAVSLAWYGIRSRFAFSRLRTFGRRTPASSLQPAPSAFAPFHGRFMSALLTDLRHASRALRRNPGPVVVSGLSLSLGIAATATMISVVDAIDFRPLPYRDADRLVELARAPTGQPGSVPSLPSPGLFHAWRERTRSYEALTAASPIGVAIDDHDGMLRAARADGEYFATLGVAPLIGRMFTADDVRDGARVVVISHDLWQTRFGGDRDVVGRTVSLSWAGEYRGVSAESFTVIGVLPRGVRYPRGSDLWLPAWGGFREASASLTVVGRLRPGVSIHAARAELDGVSRRLAVEFPPNANVTGHISPLRDAIQVTADERSASARHLLLLVAAFVLMLAIINAAVVFLVRAARQTHDLAIRAALGAPRARLFTLMLGQSVIVSVGAGALGLLLAVWGIRIADARLSVATSGLAPVLDSRVMAVALILALMAGIITGLLPALRLGRGNTPRTLHQRAAGGAGGARVGRIQDVLVMTQVACALALLSSAGVLGRDFVSLVTRDPGFDADRLVYAALPLTLIASHDEAADVAERIANLPGVVDAALGGLPAHGYRYRLETGDSLTGSERPSPYRVSAEYFTTFGIPLVAGRAFTSADRNGATPVAIVNQTAAHAWWPGDTPVGKRVFMESVSGAGGEWVTIVGVTRDERVRRDMTSPIRPVLYRPWQQLTHERRRSEIFARTAGAPEALVPPIRTIVREARSGAGWQGDYVTTMAAILGDTLDPQRFRTSALTLFSILGLLLASMGLYGVVASIVNQRTSEIGIRVALGARSRDVLALVTGRGIGLAVGGMVLGLAGAFAAHRLLASLVVSESGFDPVATLVAGVCLAGVVVVACYVPGRRATRIEPTRALRE